MGAPILKSCPITPYPLVKCSVSENQLSSNLSQTNTPEGSEKYIKVDSLGSYLAGLWEGDGHIYVPEIYTIKSTNLAGELESENTIEYAFTVKSKNKRYPYLAITFHIKDDALVLHLISLLGGYVRYKKEDKAVVWIIGTRSELIRVVQLMNGYIRTPKIYQFNKLIAWLNYHSNLNIQQNMPDKSNILQNGWLTGFFEADGGFKIRFTEKLLDGKGKVKRKERIEVRIAIEQRQYHPQTNMPYKDIMETIALAFTLDPAKPNLLKTSKHNGRIYWIVEVFSLHKLSIFIDYLNKNPLLGSKSLDFKEWLIVYKMMINKEHLTESGKLKIKTIKQGINRGRTIFNWSHLNYLIK